MFPAVDYGKSISSGLIFCPSFSESFNTLRLFDASQKRAHGTFSGITADKWKMDDKKGVGKILSLRPYISGGGIDITGLSSSSGNYTVAFYAAKDTTDGAFLDVLTGRIALRSSTNALGVFFNGGWNVLEADNSWTPDIWNVNVVTLDSVSTKVKAYRDGIISASTPVPDYTAVNLGGTSSLFNYYDISSVSWAGSVAFFAIWERVLTIDDIQSISVDPWQVFEVASIKTYPKAGAASQPAALGFSVGCGTI